MSYKTLRIRWAQKLLRAKYFVVLTDKESVIVFEGVNPHDYNDSLVLASQTAELSDFYDKLGMLIKEHDQAVNKLTKGTHAKTLTKNRKLPSVAKRKTRS